jgi:hypothetical protein
MMKTSSNSNDVQQLLSAKSFKVQRCAVIFFSPFASSQITKGEEEQEHKTAVVARFTTIL